MGGLGSGWFEQRSTELRTDEYPAIDVRQLSREFRLENDVLLDSGVVARLEWRPCHFGGYRPYFQCPRCKGRCCILYKYQAEHRGANYGCQKCLNMVHPVENEDKLQRSVRRNHKALKRRCYDSSRPEGKPLWMRWPTWKRISDQFAVEAITYFENHEKIFMMLRRLDKHKPLAK